MGVKDLWTILEPTRERQPLDSLQGKTVAIDLGVWVCEMQAAIRNPTVLKPYLRNLFFRISALLQRRINVIVVADGKPPELKRQAMLDRQKARYNRGGQTVIKESANGTVGRSKFNAHLRECLELLRLMGVPVMESDGEAEATCAAMNANGMVDAVITDDSDAFPYGARLVVRNFNLDGKEPEADFYSMETIERQLGLSRTKLIALGVFLGSDYCSGGVPGVGKETAMKYLSYFSKDEDEILLKYLKSWIPTNFHGDPSLRDQISSSVAVGFEKFDKTLRTKAATAKDLVLDGVIDEYLQERRVPSTSIKWNVPNLVGLEAFFTRHLEWVSEYSVAKVVPLIAYWQLTNGQRGTVEIEAVSIVKTRIRNGQPCYEIQWRKLACDIWTTDEDFYTTIEQKQLVDRALPRLVDEFGKRSDAKKATKKSSNKTTKSKIKEPSVELSSPLSDDMDKENADVMFDLSETMERSLLLIDDEEEGVPIKFAQKSMDEYIPIKINQSTVDRAPTVDIPIKIAQEATVVVKTQPAAQQRIFTFVRPKHNSTATSTTGSISPVDHSRNESDSSKAIKDDPPSSMAIKSESIPNMAISSATKDGSKSSSTKPDESIGISDSPLPLWKRIGLSRNMI